MAGQETIAAAFEQARRRFAEVEALPRGWVDDEVPPSAQAVECGRRVAALAAVLSLVHPTRRPLVVPAVDGGVQVEVEVTASGEFTVWAYDGTTEFAYPEE